MIGYLTISKKKFVSLIVFLSLFLGANSLFGQITVLNAWSNLYHNTATTVQNITYAIPTGTDARRILVVAIASTRTTVGARTVTLTYGGQALTSVTGDMATTTVRQHTQLYYLNEAGIDAASNTTLSVTVSGGTTRITDVFAGVFDNVDQTAPIANSQTYSSGTATTASPTFATALTINANDQAVGILSSVRAGNGSARTFTYVGFWALVVQQTWTTTDGVRNAMANYAIPSTNGTSSAIATISAATLASMTAMSLHEAPKYFRSVGTGNWNATGTWEQSYDNTTWGTASSVPISSELGVTIQEGHVVTLTANATSPGLTINGSLDLATFTLTGSGIMTLGSTGTLLVGGSANFPTGFSSTVLSTGSTVNYDNGGTQTVSARTYSNLTLSGSGAKTTTSSSVAGILSIEGTATITGTAPSWSGSGYTLQYKTTDARTAGTEWTSPFAGSGGVIIANTAGSVSLNAAKTFNAGIPLTINSGSTLTPGSNLLTLGGDFINTGALTSGSGGITIAGSAATQSIDGFTTTGTVSMTKTSGTATFAGNVNGGAFTLSGSGGTLDLGPGFTHTFTGAWTRTNGALLGNTSTLNIGGTVTNTAGTFTAGTGTVNYNASGDQTLASVDYYNLVLSGSGIKTMTGVTTVGNDFSLAGTATATAASSLAITGTVTLGSGTSFNAGGLSHTVAGDWINNGSTFTSAGSTISFNKSGAQTIGGTSGTTFNNLSLGGSGTKTFGIAQAASGSLSILSGVIVDPGTFTSTANTMSFAGAGVVNGIWGHTSSSSATYFNNTYFASSTGSITVAVSSCTNPTVTITNPTAVCSPATVDLTAGAVTSGSTSGLDFTYWTNSQATVSYSTPTTASAGTYYIKGTVPATGCFDIKPVTVTVSPASVGGTVAAAQTICSGSTPSDLSLSGQTGSVVRWEKSTDAGFSSPTTIAVTSTTLSGATIGSLTANTYFRAVVQSGTCSVASSSSALITVNPVPTLTGATQAAQVCEGSAATINLTGLPASSTSTVAYSIDGVSQTPVTNVVANGSGAASFSSAVLTYANNAQVLQVTGITTTSATPNCSASFSRNVTLDVSPPSVGGTVASNQTICSGTTPADLTLSGNTGSVVRWEKSTDAGFSSPTVISVTNTTLSGATIGSLTSDTYFRAIVQSGVCSTATSTAVLITVRPTPTGSISGTTAVCQNASSPLITFTNPQSLPVTISYDINGSNQASINVAASSTATLSAPTSSAGVFAYNLVSVSYQTGAACPNTISGTATITVNSRPAPTFTVQPGANACMGSDVTYTTESGQTNYVWTVPGVLNTDYSITSGGLGSSSNSVVLKWLTAGTKTVTINYTNASGCTAASATSSTTTTVTVIPTIDSTTGGSVCGSGTVTLGATASAGATINWYAGLSGGSSLGTGTSFTTPSISSTTTYYVDATNNGCVSTPRTAVVATVVPIVTASVSIAANTGNSICSGVSVTFTATPVNGGATPAYQWKLNGSNVGTNSPTYTNSALADGNTVSCVMTSSVSSCLAGSPATSNTITMSVATTQPASVTISANPGNAICQGNSVTFTAIPTGGGATPSYQWKKNGTDIGGAVSSQYTSTTLVQGDIITCVMTTSLVCASGSPATSDGITMTVYDPLTASIAGGSSPICYNTGPGTLTATGGGGNGTYTYLWYKNGTTTGITTQTYNPGNLTASSTFYCALTSGTCTTVSNTISITVNNELTAGISGGISPICFNTAPGTFTATGSGGTGSYTYQWYNTEGIILNETNATYTPGNLSVTTGFYCAVTSGACGTVNTPTTTIQVRAFLTASISVGTSPICYNDNPGTFTATGGGGTGSYTYLWYKNGVSTGVETQTYTPGSLTSTTTFSCLITSGSCGSLNSNTVTITVYDNLTASISGGSSPICYNSNPGTLTAAGSGGSGSYTFLWYKNGVSTGVTDQTYSPGNLTTTSSFYCAVTSGTCGTVNSNTTTISVYPDFTAAISGGTSPICYNDAPGTLTATGSGGTGSYSYLWYANGVSTGVTTQNYSPGSLTATSTFYCAVTSGSCGTVNTSTTTITVYGNLTAVISGGASPICYNSSPGTLTAVASGGPGSYTYQWYSTSGILTGETNSTYNPGNLTSTTGYYCAVTSGSCGTVNTLTKTITVYSNLTAGISGGTSPICYNSSPGTFTASGSGGNGTYTYQWYNSSGIINGATNATYNPGNITVTTGFYCAVTSGSCGTVNTTTTTITVYNNLTALISGGTTPICYNTAPGTLTAAGGGGTGSYTYLWYKNGVTTGVTTQTYAPGNLTASSTFVCEITSGSCGPVNSNTISITVTPLPNATITYPGSPFCTSLAGPQSVSLTGTSGGTYTSTAGLTIDSGTGAITPSTSTAGTYTVTYTVAAFGGCSEFSTTTEVTIVHDLVWTGAVDTDWNTPGNWSCLVVPDLTTNVLIPDVANKPVLSSGATGLTKNIEINLGSSLTITGNTIQIAGTLINSGIFNAAGGTVEMKGSVAQTIAANLFSDNTILNLTVNNAAGVTLLGPLNVTGIVKAQSGNLTSNGNLTLVSSSGQTALIDGSGSGDMIGSVTMQRYLPTAFGYKYFSSPFQSSTVNEFADDMDLTAAFPTFYLYDENRLTPALTPMSGWTNYTEVSGLLNPLEGYAVNFGKVSAPNTADVTGVVNNGSLQKTLWNHNNTYTQGFNLVGNPYPSPIDWNASGWTKTNIDNAIYFFNASGTTGNALADDTIQYQGTYSSYVNGTSTGNGTNLIASMQGFFVHVTDGTYPVQGTLGVSNTIRTNDLNPSFKRANFDNRQILRFSAAFDTGNTSEDVALIYFDGGATMNFDNEMDALKMKNTDPQVPNLYSFSRESRQLSINGMPNLSDSLTEIPLGLQTLTNGTLIFTAKDITQLPFGWRIYLLDARENILQDLQQYPEYRISLNAGEYNNRFSLILSKTEITNPADIVKNLFEIFRSNNQILIKVNLPYNTSGNLLVTNMSGQVIEQRVVQDGETVKVDLMVDAGIYLITVRSATRAQSEKLLMRLNYE